MYNLKRLLVGYNQNADFLKKVYNLDIKTGMYFSVKAESFEEARDILDKQHIKRN